MESSNHAKNGAKPKSQMSRIQTFNNQSMKTKGTAYLLWFLSIFGWLGFHHFYMGKIGKGILWILTGGVFGIGSLIDLFTLGGQVESYNTKQELKTIRTAAMGSAAAMQR